MILGALFASCSSVHLLTADTDQRYSQTSPERIEVYSLDKIGKPYVIIGQVVANAEAFSDDPVSIDNLKKEAALIGADAIINLRLEIGEGFMTNTVIATGTAVKLNGNNNN